MPKPSLRLLVWLVFIVGLCCSVLAVGDDEVIDDPANPTDEGAPYITSTPVLTAVVGQAYSYDVDAIGSPPPTYSLAQFPAGMWIETNSGLIQWFPSEPGIFNVTVQALNSYGSYVQSFSVSVTPAPKAPQIYSTPTTTMLNDEAYVYDVNATGYPPPIYKLTQSPSGMTISAASGRIDWNPPGAGSFDITVLVENSEGSDEQSFILNVYEFPAITSDPDTTATMNNTYQYDVEATGTPAPAYALTEYPVGMTINNTTGLIDWLPDSAGHFDITIQAGNPAGVSVQEYVLRVESVYESPSIFSTPVVEATVGELYSYDINASGSPQPTYSLVFFPNGMTVNAATGLVEWTPTVDGDFDVRVQADNLAGYMIQDFTITVEKAAAAPSILSVPPLEGTSGELYTYDVNASGYPEPVFSLVSGPTGMTLDPITGLTEWTPTGGGNFEVILRASNIWGTDLQIFVIHTESPQAPQITSIPITSVGAGQRYYYDVDATGYPTPAYSLDAAPNDMAIDSITGEIYWNPLIPADYDMTIRATNAVGSFTQSFVLSVVEAYQAPFIVTTPSAAAEVGEMYTYDVDATGYPIPTFQLALAPTGMTINSTTGLVEWTPDSYGSFEVELLAMNSVGTDTQNFYVSTSCCGAFTTGQTGNTNCDVEGKRNLADITRLIDNVYISKQPLCCTENGNVNGDTGDKVNLADITRLIDHVYISKNETASCN